MATFTKLYAYASLLSLVGMQAFAANDWSVPCMQGKCSYDLPSDSSSSASLQVWGSSTSISDITEAAGWKILDCDPNGMNQTIRMVCMNADSQSAGCDHVMQNGAEHTLVRMPKSCGKMPFARVARMWVPTDQSIPAATKRMLWRRDGTTPTVHAMTIDTDFGAANDSSHGNVSFAVQGLTAPGGQFPSAAPTAQGRRYISRPVMDMKHRRGLFGSIGNALQGKFNETKKTDSKPVDVSINKTLLSLDVDCPDVNGHLQVDLDAKAHADITVGATAVGTVIPPKLDDFGLLLGLDGNIDGSLTFQASAQGHFDSGPIPIFTVGIPGFDFPGIFTLGPTFNVNGEITGDVNLQIDLTVGLAYSISNAQLEFPPGQSSSSGTFGPSDNNLDLSVSPDLSGSASVSAHLIPQLNIGLDVLSIASANIFLDLDASATLSVNGSLKGNEAVGGILTGATSADGCADVSTGLNVHAGADASLFGFFNPSTQVSLFSKNFDLFDGCFAPKTSSSSTDAASSTKASSADTSTATSTGKSANGFTDAGTAGSNGLAKRLDLSCSTAAPVISIISKLVSAADQSAAEE
ncbi:hypothetical protein EVG20_g6519 [Dentipellis fragilis]|uniref:DUF7223 domain-containing protein n=1 Tax=Dentipellis fragilis TaxID=205917 RepID=A0A4Y9YK50_9AGAM|nr:hypothetical protein EVG20_g6519 [Dentipellis fragilis]